MRSIRFPKNRIFYGFCVAIFLHATGFAQTGNSGTNNQPEIDSTNPTNNQPAAGNNPSNEPAANSSNANSVNNAQNSASDITGFDGIAWGETYEKVKDKFRTLSSSEKAKDPVEIIRDVPEREILIKRRDIFYRYVFYKRPDNLVKNEEQGKGLNEPEFFFVETIFHLVPAEELYKKLKAKYGDRTSSTLNKEMRGVYKWDTAKGQLVQWINAYQNRPFSRSLFYISAEIRKKIQDDLQDYQYDRELKAIEGIVP